MKVHASNQLPAAREAKYVRGKQPGCWIKSSKIRALETEEESHCSEGSRKEGREKGKNVQC